jgi:hypothetical protein
MALDGYNPNTTLLPSSQGGEMIHAMRGGYSAAPPGYEPTHSLLPEVSYTIRSVSGGNRYWKQRSLDLLRGGAVGSNLEVDAKSDAVIESVADSKSTVVDTKIPKIYAAAIYLYDSIQKNAKDTEDKKDAAVDIVDAINAINTIGIQRGAVTHHHDQLISPVNFRVINIRNNTIPNPKPLDELFLLLLMLCCYKFFCSF